MHREATVLSRKTEEERKRKECKRKECKEEFLASASSDVAGVTTATDSPAENPPSLPSRPQQSKSSPTVPTTTVFSNSTQDVCIRTRGAEFRANGALLVQHSGLFDEMIHLESGLHKRTRDGRLILELDEPASAVHRLLALVHLQAADPAVDVLEDLETCVVQTRSRIAVPALTLLSASLDCVSRLKSFYYQRLLLMPSICMARGTSTPTLQTSWRLHSSSASGRSPCSRSQHSTSPTLSHTAAAVPAAGRTNPHGAHSTFPGGSSGVFRILPLSGFFAAILQSAATTTVTTIGPWLRARWNRYGHCPGVAFLRWSLCVTDGAIRGLPR